MTVIDGRNRSATNKSSPRFREFPKRNHAPKAAIRRGVNKILKPNNHRQLNVLVIGIVRQDVEATLRTVREAGHAAFGADDSHSALCMAAVVHPDVVLVNVGNPNLASHFITRNLRRDFAGQKILIIGIAGCRNEVFQRLRRESDFDLVLTSPLDSEFLETVLFLESVRVNRLESEASVCFESGESQKSFETKPIAGIAIASVTSSGFFSPVVQTAG